MTGHETRSPNHTSRSLTVPSVAGAAPSASVPPAWNSTRGIRPVAVTRTFTIWTGSFGLS